MTKGASSCMPPIYRPASGPKDWRSLLADPARSLKTGYFERAMAHAWEETVSSPPEIRKALAAHFNADIEPLCVVPEHKVAMPGCAAGPSQNDVFMFACIDPVPDVGVAEGMVKGSFDGTIGEWINGSSAAGQTRIEGLCPLLGLVDSPDPGLRYQLLLRAASAILEAELFGADHSVILAEAQPD